MSLRVVQHLTYRCVECKLRGRLLQRQTGYIMSAREQLRTARLNRGLTLADVAAATGLSRSTISRLENGRVAFSLASAQLLANYYGFTVDDLVRDRVCKKGVETAG